MKRIYAVDDFFIYEYNSFGKEITDAEWMERAEENGTIWSSPSTFAFDFNDNELCQGMQIRVIDIEGTYEESNDRFDRPVLFIPTEMTYRGMDEVTIADLATHHGEVYDDFADFVYCFNNNSTFKPHQMQMFVGSMTLEMMQEILNTLGKEENDNKVAVRLTRDQIDDIVALILGESSRLRTIEDGIHDSAVRLSINAYRERLLDTMNDIHSQLPNE